MAVAVMINTAAGGEIQTWVLLHHMLPPDHCRYLKWSRRRSWRKLIMTVMCCDSFIEEMQTATQGLVRSRTSGSRVGRS